jgi:hypothetical protein
MAENIEKHDGLTIWRCPPLGGPVPFRHCRRSGAESLPCRRLPECWADKIDAGDFIASNYSPEQIETAFGLPQKTRLDTILETLDKTVGGAKEKRTKKIEKNENLF